MKRTIFLLYPIRHIFWGTICPSMFVNLGCQIICILYKNDKKSIPCGMVMEMVRNSKFNLQFTTHLFTTDHLLCSTDSVTIFPNEGSKHEIKLRYFLYRNACPRIKMSETFDAIHSVININCILSHYIDRLNYILNNNIHFQYYTYNIQIFNSIFLPRYHLYT